MASKPGKRKTTKMIRDIFESHSDLSGLAERYKMQPADLAAWIEQDDNRRCLSGLCLLADFQTQLMLSRYRQVAVTELIKQATGSGEDGGVSPEQARKACVDLLKADLKRASPPTPSLAEPHANPSESSQDIDELHAIRDALFGHASDPTADTPTHGESS